MKEELVLYIDPNKDIRLNWPNIKQRLIHEEFYSPFALKSSFDEVFLQLVDSLILDEPVTLLDINFTKEELYDLGVTPEQLNKRKRKPKVYPNSYNDFILGLDCLKNWSLTLFTSGTTGLPKKVVHNFESITRGSKISNKFENHIWGWAYNPTHMAGIQVFFQAILNGNLLVMLFEKSRSSILTSIKKFKITHLSATPTFFRLLLPLDEVFEAVKSLTFGGEKMDTNLLNELKISFPNAQFRNVYASTEAGSLFSSEGEYFKINIRIKPYVKFIENEICLHKSLLGANDYLLLDEIWYKTGDLVEFIDEELTKFRFLSRKNEIINVGGYKVNPNEIEELLNSHANIIISRVIGKPNSVLGNIIVAEVVSNTKTLSEKQLRVFLNDRIQPFKIPRLISFVDEISLTRSGKKSNK